MNPSYLLTAPLSPHVGVCGVNRGPSQSCLALMPPSGPCAEKGLILEVGNSPGLHGSQPAGPSPFGEANLAQLGPRRHRDRDRSIIRRRPPVNFPKDSQAPPPCPLRNLGERGLGKLRFKGCFTKHPTRQLTTTAFFSQFWRPKSDSRHQRALLPLRLRRGLLASSSSWCWWQSDRGDPTGPPGGESRDGGVWLPPWGRGHSTRSPEAGSSSAKKARGRQPVAWQRVLRPGGTESLQSVPFQEAPLDTPRSACPPVCCPGL